MKTIRKKEFEKIMKYLNVEKRKIVKVLKNREIQITDEAFSLLNQINDDNSFFLNSKLIRKRRQGSYCGKIFE